MPVYISKIACENAHTLMMSAGESDDDEGGEILGSRLVLKFHTMVNANLMPPACTLCGQRGFRLTVERREGTTEDAIQTLTEEARNATCDVLIARATRERN